MFEETEGLPDCPELAQRYRTKHVPPKRVETLPMLTHTSQFDTYLLRFWHGLRFGRTLAASNPYARAFRPEVSAEEAREPAAGPEIQPPCERHRRKAYLQSAHSGRERLLCVRQGHKAGPACQRARFLLRHARGHHFEL